MSPQEGKSERVSHAFALWLLVQNPELRIAIVSYSDEMARRHGAAIKSDAQTFTTAPTANSTSGSGSARTPARPAAGRSKATPAASTASASAAHSPASRSTS
jgi:hypothetical protein